MLLVERYASDTPGCRGGGTGIRTIICITKAVEGLNARFWQVTRRRGHFGNEQAAFKMLYPVIRTPQKNRTNITGRACGWKVALKALTMFCGGRITLS